MFKVGEIVVCVEQTSQLKLGEEYEVLKFNYMYVTVKEIPYSAFLHSRFISLKRLEKITKIKERINGNI